MKKYIKLFTALVAGCALLASCATREEEFSGNGREIKFSASVGTFQVKATDTAFERADAVGLSTIEGITSIDNARLVWNGNALEPENPIYWNSRQSDYDESLFIATYPYAEGRNNYDFEFCVNADQSTHALYTASDLMFASALSAPADGSVHLNFVHKLSKIILKIDNMLDNEEIAEVFMGNVNGLANIKADGNVYEKGDYGTIKAGKVTLEDGSPAWVLIIVPQYTNPRLMITTTSGKQYTYDVQNRVYFASGRRYLANVVIDASSIATDFTSDVIDWVDDNDIQFGQEDIPVAKVWSLIGEFSAWDGDVDLLKVSDSPEIWELDGITLPEGGVKFRGDHIWGDLDLGAPYYDDFEFIPNEFLPLIYFGANIIVPAGTYDIFLYPQDPAVVFVPVETPDSGNELGWTVAFRGNQWVEGYYKYGQLAVFEASNTDGRYYDPIIVKLSEGEESILEAFTADPETYLAQLQEDVTMKIQAVMELYGETLEQALYSLYYRESDHGTSLLYYGLPAGEYEYAVFTMDEEGNLDGGYQIITFTIDEDAESVYPWVDTPKFREDWTAEYVDWENEGVSFWISGTAKDAAYVMCDWFTEEELDYYFGGIGNYINSLGSNSADYIYNKGSDPADFMYPVAADGSFEALIETYDLEGPYPVNIVGFDADGRITGYYGISEIETPEIAPVEWKERTDWAGNYDEQNPDGITVSVCDAEYFVVEIYPEGFWSEDDDIESIADNATYYAQSYGLETCMAYGYVFNSVPAVYVFENAYYYDGNANGCDVFIFGIKENGKPTGEWHREVLTGAPEVESVDLELVEDWNVTIDGTPYYVEYDGGDYLVVDVVVNAPGIDYYYIEENTQDDLDKYYDGTILSLALYYQQTYKKYIGYGYSMDDFLDYEMTFNENCPATSMEIYNPGIESTIYILEFDKNGSATGRYGATTLTLPEEPDEVRSVVPAKAAKLKFNVVPGLHARTVSGKAAAKSATSKTIQKGGKAGAKPAFSANVQPKSHPVNVDASRLSKGGKAKAKAGVKAVSRINKHDLKAGRR